MGLLEVTNSRIAVTTDMWASNQKKGIMGITAHYIKDSWRLQSRILRFIYIPCAHIADSLSTVLMEYLFDWNIDQKLSTLTVDNCTTNDDMINIMLDKLSLGSLLLNGKFFHLRCCAHILNLMVKDGLDIISPSVERIHDSISYWLATPKRVETFEAVARQMKIHCAKGTKYPTSNLYFPNICDIKLTIRNWSTSSCDEVKWMASSMKEKFEKYWSDMHGILAVATVLDPRYKMKLVEYYFPLIFGDKEQVEIEKVRAFCHKLLKEYKRPRHSTENTSQSSLSSQLESSTTVGKHFRIVGFDTFVSHSVTADYVKTEVDVFLDDPVLPRVDGFDLLSWWKANSIKYPTLHKVARDLLVIPVSTVASESAFNTSGRFVSPHRNRLHPKTLEILMCAQDWFWTNIHENSVPSSYSGVCAGFSDEDIDKKESTLSLDS